MPEIELLSEIDPARGIMCDNPLRLPAGALVDARNVLYDRGRLKKRRGYSVIKATGLADLARLAFFFRTATGEARLVAATHDTLFSYNAGTNVFDNKGALTGTDIPYLDACKWGAGIVYVTKRGQAFKKWDGGAGNFTDANASGIGNTYYWGVFELNDLTAGGTYSGSTSSTYWVEIDGVDSPNTFRWRKDAGAWTSTVAITGAAQTLAEGLTVTFGATTGHTLGDYWTIGLAPRLLPTFLRRFGGRLVGAYITQGGVDYRQRIAWTAPNLPESWAGYGSGYEERVNLEGALTGLEPVGRGLAVFAEESIEVMLFTGPASAPFSFQAAEPTVGTLSGKSVCKLGPPFSGQLAFLGSDYNIHVFDGIHAIPVGDAIQPMLKDLLELEYLPKACAQVLPLEGIYRLAVTVSGATENNFIIDWHYRRGQFYFHEFAGTNKAWSACARWIKSSALTWTQLNTLGTTWGALDMTWAELMQESGWRFVGFLGTAGDFCGLFEGGNDGAAGIPAWAEFAPVTTPGDQVSESAYLEILDDRSSPSTLGVSLGASRDGAHFSWESRAHSLAPTSQPFEDYRMQGKWFALRIANSAVGEQFGLRGWRLWGLPALGMRR